MLSDRIKMISQGYSEVKYRNKKYGITRSDFKRGKSIKIYARHLGGSDVISLNYYIIGKKELLKPCEMPEIKVIEFLNNFQNISDESGRQQQ